VTWTSVIRFSNVSDLLLHGGAFEAPSMPERSGRFPNELPLNSGPSDAARLNGKRFDISALRLSRQ